MSKSKGKRFVLPKPSNNEDLNTDFSSRLKYYDDEKRGILNIVIIKQRSTRKSTPKTVPKSASKTVPKSASKTVPKSASKTPKTSSKTVPKSASKTVPKSASKTPKTSSKTGRVMSRT